MNETIIISIADLLVTGNYTPSFTLVFIIGMGLVAIFLGIILSVAYIYAKILNYIDNLITEKITKHKNECKNFKLIK